MVDVPTALKSIALEYLFDGMVLGEDIYSHDGSLLLLAKGNTIHGNQLAQLKRFNANRPNISVFGDTYQLLMKHGLSATSHFVQESLEEKVGYSSIANKTADLLTEVRVSNSISKDDTDQIASRVSDSLNSIDPALVFQCINAPNPIDEYLRRHSVNVGLLNGLMGRWLELTPEEIDTLVLGGIVHDMGKTKIPSEILDAPRRLTVSEFEVMQMHPIYSWELLGTDKRFSKAVRLTARHHHEKMNGSGYPDGLRADRISLFARITSVSDIYDAMVSRRSYKEAQNPFSIIASLAKSQFSELDVGLVSLFTEHMPAELVGKSVLLSDGSVGTIKYILPNDLEYPLVEINGGIQKTNPGFHCQRMVFDE